MQLFKIKQIVTHRGITGLVEPYDEIRYIITDFETGEVLDDADGNGYATAQQAYEAWASKNNIHVKSVKHNSKGSQIKEWLNQHNDFCNTLFLSAMEIEYGYNDAKFDPEFVNGLLAENGYTDVPFTSEELFKYIFKDW